MFGCRRVNEAALGCSGQLPNTRRGPVASAALAEQARREQERSRRLEGELMRLRREHQQVEQVAREASGEEDGKGGLRCSRRQQGRRGHSGHPLCPLPLPNHALSRAHGAAPRPVCHWRGAGSLPQPAPPAGGSCPGPARQAAHCGGGCATGSWRVPGAAPGGCGGTRGPRAGECALVPAWLQERIAGLQAGADAGWPSTPLTASACLAANPCLGAHCPACAGAGRGED